MTDNQNDARAEGPDAVAIDAVPKPVVGYKISSGDPEIATTNDAFEAEFSAVSDGASVREWLLRNCAVDEETAADACAALTDGGALEVETRVQSVDEPNAEPQPVRLRSFGESDGGDAVDGYVLVTKLAPTSADKVELNRVASVITHDLRNPLDVAKAHLQAARETGESSHFDQVEDAHDRMEQIIRDALALARGGRALDITESVAIDTVAADAWATVDTGTASLSVAESLPQINADSDRLQRLFENLFRNAVEHGPAGSPNATEPDRDEAVRVRVESIDGGFLVADDGSGIPVSERERVFEPGYSSTETGSGTGLGLTIVEQIARAHDWTVSVEEGSRGGARFEFRSIADDD
ncbi:sensor histidine kinase [Natrinema marinum]|uniref:sensor histidine kinase n=1 Tax=Natrinema marinum TaxID=2961598 RepID=UPI0020C883D5|nr:HAMP domain-containing sensor histidine kinase [Natrinema marinum]